MSEAGTSKFKEYQIKMAVRSRSVGRRGKGSKQSSSSPQNGQSKKKRSSQRAKGLVAVTTLSALSSGRVPEPEFPFLQGYPEALLAQVRTLLGTGQLQETLARRYPELTTIKTDGLLRPYVLNLKNRFVKRGSPLSKICFDENISTLHGALGLHTFATRVQGTRSKTKNELRVASVFKNLPEPFLRMVVVHELAHLKEKEHNKAFYQLCCYMEPDYHKLELDLRLYLTAQARDETRKPPQ